MITTLKHSAPIQLRFLHIWNQLKFNNHKRNLGNTVIHQQNGMMLPKYKTAVFRFMAVDGTVKTTSSIRGHVGITGSTRLGLGVPQLASIPAMSESTYTISVKRYLKTASHCSIEDCDSFEVAQPTFFPSVLARSIMITLS
jgi:hypothetical protein